MIIERLQEVVFFFRANWLALLIVTLPFAVASTVTVYFFGQPLPSAADGPASQTQWQSPALLFALYPLAMGVKTLAIHHLASGTALSLAGLLTAALRLWPTLAAIALLGALFVGSVTLLSLGVGIELLQGAGLLRGPVAGLLFLFVLPGVYLYARIGCAPIIAVTEGTNALNAMSAAWQRSLPQHAAMFWSLLLLGSLLLLVIALVLTVISGSGEQPAAEGHTGLSTAGSLFAQALAEWLFCLLTILFYRYWSLLHRSA